MNVQETLAQIDHIITEVDLELHDWQEALDMMSFIGLNASIELWTDDVPPQIITKDTLKNAVGKEVRVMHNIDGAWTKVGTAKVGANGEIFASVDRDIPGITDGFHNHFSLGNDGGLRPFGALAHFEMASDGSVKQNIPLNPPFEGQNKPLTIRGLEEAIAKIENKKFTTNMHVKEDELTDGVHPKMTIDGQEVETGKYIDLANHPFFKEES